MPIPLPFGVMCHLMGGGRLRRTSEGHSPEAQVLTILAYTVLYFCILILCFSVLGVSIVISLSSHILS